MELSATRDDNVQRMKHALSRLRVWPLEAKAAAEYGRIFAHCQRAGRMIQQIDMQIAAIALSLGNCTVVTKDADFAEVPGLRIENWAEATPSKKGNSKKKK